MIVALVQETCQILQEIDTRENAKSIAESVQETLGALETLKERVHQLQGHVQVLRSRLPPSEVQAALEVSQQCAQQIRHHASRFAIQPRQKNELQSVQNHIQRALAGLQKAWKSYAMERTHEPFELYVLVCHLPEVEAQQARYNELKHHLQVASEIMPSSEQQLQAFDQAIEQFTRMLGEIRGLNEAVKAFLLKTLGGTATLADVTDDVLQWCRQG